MKMNETMMTTTTDEKIKNLRERGNWNWKCKYKKVYECIYTLRWRAHAHQTFSDKWFKCILWIEAFNERLLLLTTFLPSYFTSWFRHPFPLTHIPNTLNTHTHNKKVCGNCVRSNLNYTSVNIDLTFFPSFLGGGLNTLHFSSLHPLFYRFWLRLFFSSFNRVQKLLLCVRHHLLNSLEEKKNELIENLLSLYRFDTLYTKLIQ